MRRILTYLLAIIACVGCSTFEPMDPDNSDPQPEPKPVRPIKPRPIVPDGTISRPRIVEVDFNLIERLPSIDGASPYCVMLCTEQGDVVAEVVLASSDEVLSIEVEGTEPLYIYVNDEYVAEYDTDK
ncbi:MAG: hypothetical protein J6Q36_07545 [Alistipes sp.]|nr:hypothetical protein [Alistipes sp.]